MVVLDIETLDFFGDAHIKRLPRPVQLLAMRFGMATIYNTDSGEWKQYWPAPDVVELPDVTCYAAGSDALCFLWKDLVNQAVLGWNIFDFDIPFLMLHLSRRGYDNDPWLDPMQIIDLMAQCKAASKAFGRERWYKLQDISLANLGQGKDGDGQQAALWLREGDADERQAAARYCKNDVQLCLDLFMHAQGPGLLLPGRPERGEAGDLRLWLDNDGQIVDCRREVSS